MSHYLKLNVPQPIVVNESYDVLILPGIIPDSIKFSNSLNVSDIPVFSEFLPSLVNYPEIESKFVSDNSAVLATMRNQLIGKLEEALKREIVTLSLE